MKLNVKKVIESYQKVYNRRYEPKAMQLKELYEMSSNPFDLITNAFAFGYVQGMKAAKAKMKKNS